MIKRSEMSALRMMRADALKLGDVLRQEDKPLSPREICSHIAAKAIETFIEIENQAENPRNKGDFDWLQLLDDDERKKCQEKSTLPRDFVREELMKMYNTAKQSEVQDYLAQIVIAASHQIPKVQELARALLAGVKTITQKHQEDKIRARKPDLLKTLDQGWTKEVEEVDRAMDSPEDLKKLLALFSRQKPPLGDVSITKGPPTARR